jgi:hypothetical protein
MKSQHLYSFVVSTYLSGCISTPFVTHSSPLEPITHLCYRHSPPHIPLPPASTHPRRGRPRSHHHRGRLAGQDPLQHLPGAWSRRFRSPAFNPPPTSAGRVAPAAGGGASEGRMLPRSSIHRSPRWDELEEERAGDAPRSPARGAPAVGGGSPRASICRPGHARELASHSILPVHIIFIPPSEPSKYFAPTLIISS